jgi:hypothetical protein
LVGTLLPDLRENNVKRDGVVAPEESNEAPDDAEVGVLTLSLRAGEESGFLALKLNNLEVLTLIPGEGLGSAGGVVDGTMDADPSDKLERLLPGFVDIWTAAASTAVILSTVTSCDVSAGASGKDLLKSY